MSIANIGLEQLNEWALRSSLLIVAAALVAGVLRNRTAASTRHALWAFAIGASLALPLMSRVLPAWRILPTLSSTSEVQGAALPTSERTSVIISIPDSSAYAAVDHPHGEMVASGNTAPISWGQWVFGAWAIGSVLCVLRLLMGHGSLCFLIRRRSLRHQSLSVEYSNEIRLCDRQMPPMVCGLFRPVILLPSAALDWPRLRLHAVVQHELAHVRRGDLWWGSLASVLCALQWFNPLAWLAARQRRNESEYACDDAVIRGGVTAGDYAGHLLEVASMLERPSRSLPAAAMATGPEVEGRLKYALDKRRDRRPLGKRRALCLAILLAPIVSAVAIAVEDDAEPAVKNEAKVVEQPAAEKKVVPRKVQKTIVIDPGHGGNDTGEDQAGGIVEKDLTLKLALALRERLENAGFRVVLTRFDDSRVSLIERVDIANKHLGGVMLSLQFSGQSQKHTIYTKSPATAVGQQFSAKLVDALKSGGDVTEVESKTGRFGILKKPMITAALFEAPLPKPDVADAELARMAEALASGISTWSRLPPPPPIKAGEGALSIEAANVDYDAERKLVVATGDVQIRLNDDIRIVFDGQRAEYGGPVPSVKLWAASMKITSKNGQNISAKAGIIEYDENAGSVVFKNGFEVLKDGCKYLSKEARTIVTLNIKTGELTILGPSITQVVKPAKLGEEEAPKSPADAPISKP